jgi:putative toxin-antitoxin system antitoxin component (TIGR02293 family)
MTPLYAKALFADARRRKDGVHSALQVHEAIQAGLSGASLAEVKQLLGLDNRSLGRLIGVMGDKTIARRLTARRLPAVESDRVWRSLALFAQAVEAFDGDEAAAREWFHHPSLRLGRLTPIQLIGTEAGVRLVESALGAIEHGLPV